ncbi:MAG: hypothetical protein L0312_32930 [Acidobacteria bacterium]|nr:hypothetical protein [Acidobacteriota bacterium]
MNRQAKGARLEKLAKEWLEALGYSVELCPNTIAWIPDKDKPPKMVNGKPRWPLRPIAVRRDFWGCWDGVAVNDFERFFFQVGVLEDAAHKRAQVSKCPFSPKPQDRILAYIAGRSRHFRVLRAPDFQWTGECLMPKERVPTEDDTRGV